MLVPAVRTVLCYVPWNTLNEWMRWLQVLVVLGNYGRFLQMPGWRLTWMIMSYYVPDGNLTPKIHQYNGIGSDRIKLALFWILEGDPTI